MGRRGNVRRPERVVAAADRDAIHGRAGGGNLHAAGDDGFRPAGAVAGNPVIGALEGDVLVDVDVLAVGPGRDPDDVTGRRRVDRRRDGGVAAVADEQDVVTAAVGDLLDARERVGALGAAGVDDEVAETVFGEHRTGERSGVDRGIGAGAADESVVAAAASERVVAALAVERVVASVAGDDVGVAVAGTVDVAAASQRQVLDIGAERVADRRLHRVGARVERFRHHVAGVVDDVGVVAGAADHGVGAGPAVERVVARAAVDQVAAAGPIMGEIFAGGAARDPGLERQAGHRIVGKGDDRVGDRQGLVAGLKRDRSRGGRCSSARGERVARHRDIGRRAVGTEIVIGDADALARTFDREGVVVDVDMGRLVQSQVAATLERVAFDAGALGPVSVGVLQEKVGAGEVDAGDGRMRAVEDIEDGRSADIGVVTAGDCDVVA